MQCLRNALRARFERSLAQHVDGDAGLRTSVSAHLQKVKGQAKAECDRKLSQIAHMHMEQAKAAAPKDGAVASGDGAEATPTLPSSKLMQGVGSW